MKGAGLRVLGWAIRQVVPREDGERVTLAEALTGEPSAKRLIAALEAEKAETERLRRELEATQDSVAHYYAAIGKRKRGVS